MRWLDTLDQPQRLQQLQPPLSGPLNNFNVLSLIHCVNYNSCFNSQHCIAYTSAQFSSYKASSGERDASDPMNASTMVLPCWGQLRALSQKQKG